MYENSKNKSAVILPFNAESPNRMMATAPSITYSFLKCDMGRSSSMLAEYSPDSIVRAMARVIECTYDDIYISLSQIGWTTKKPFNFSAYAKKYTIRDIRFVPIQIPSPFITLGQFCEAMPKGRFILCKKDYYYAVVNDWVYDVKFALPETQITKCWSAVPS